MALAARDGIEVVFETGGKVVVHIALKVFGEEVVDDFTDGGRDEAAVFLFDVFTLLQCADDAGVGGRTANAVGFEFFDEGGFGVARRRLGEVLAAGDVVQLDAVTVFHWRQQAVVVVFFFVVFAFFLVHAHVAREFDGAAVGTELVFFAAGVEVSADVFEDGRGHLRGDGAFSDEFVEFVFVAAETKRGTVPTAVGGADGFVRFLCVLGFGFVVAGFIRQVVRAVLLGDPVADSGNGFLSEVDGVGPHVGDVTFFVKTLRDTHGFLRTEVEFACRCLLHGGGGKGRRGVALAVFFVDVGDKQAALGGCFQGINGGLGIGSIGEAEFFGFFAVVNGKFAGEGLTCVAEGSSDVPVFFAVEGFYFALAFDNHAQGGRLDAPGGESGADFAPQQR